MVNHPLAGIGAEPVSGDAPCGAAVRYDPDFEALEAEITKQESLTPEPVDWPTVNRLAADILKSKSKDLLVAAYLSRGLLETEGYNGLAAGMQVIRDLVDGYWDGMFPPLKRARARATAMQWLAERSVAVLAEKPPTEADAEAVIQAESLLREIDGTLVEKMGDDAPNLMELSRPLRDLKRNAESQRQAAAPPPAEPAAQPAPDSPASGDEAGEAQAPGAEPDAAPSAEPPPPPPPPAPKPAARTAPAAAAASPAAIESDNDARKALRGVQDSLRKTAAFMLQSSLTDVRAYRLNRIATWLMIDQAPPNQDGLTQLAVVPEPRRKQLQQLFDQSQFSALLPELEQTLSRASFWLDGQRLAVGALQGMGAEASAAAQVVIGEIRLLLSRVPELPALKFTDGTPFADDQTRMWLDAEVLVSAGGPGEAGDASPWVAALSEARSKLVGGDAKAAYALFEQGAANAACARERFCWRTGFAELLVQSGRHDVALPMLESAAEQIAAQRLDEWEPELAANVYRLQFEAYSKLQKKSKDPKNRDSKDNGELAALESKAYAMLCRVAPARAVALKED